MSNIIDRRLNPRDKTLRNRQKFIQRSREEVKRAVKESIDKNNIADIVNNKAKVRVKGTSEPTFRHNHKTGDKRYVMPGNKDFVVGDRQDKPPEDGGQGGTKGGLGESEDDFDFILNKDEYLDFIFEDLELPDLVKKQVKDVTKTESKRSGFTNTGNPSNLDVVRSLKNSMGRRIGLGRPKDEEIATLERQLDETDDQDLINELRIKLEALLSRRRGIPWLDPVDVRYRNFVQQPKPTTQCVMICVMDVSASMGQREKDIAKRFFFLLHLFLNRKYQRVDIVFVRHHESAKEVDEEEFFNSRESGGTVVSSGLELTHKIISDRYPVNDWNIYVAQVGDGDNYGNDLIPTKEALTKLLPLVQYFAYVEIGRTFMHDLMNTDLWDTYEPFAEEYKHLAMRTLLQIDDIWKVFKGLFSKETA